MCLCGHPMYLPNVFMHHAYKALGCSMAHVKADRMKLTVNGLILTDDLRLCDALPSNPFWMKKIQLMC